MEARSVNKNVKYFSLRGKEIAYNPADLEWAENFMNMLDEIEAVSRLSEAEEDIMDSEPRKFFGICREKSNKIRGIIDAFFGEGTSEAYYDSNFLNPEDGFPVWLNFSIEVVDAVEAAMKEQQAIGNQRLAKYTKKYEQYKKKSRK